MDDRKSSTKTPSQEDSVSSQASTVTDKPKPSCLKKVSNVLIGSLERVYYKVGVAIGRRPVLTICLFILVTFLCLTGMVKFHQIDPFSPEWTDPDSEYIRDKNWVDEKFPSEVRVNSYLLIVENVLERDTLLEIYDIHNHVTNVINKDFDTYCKRVGSGDNAPCYSTGILELWSYNQSVINGLTAADIRLKANTTARSPVTGAPFDLGLVLGSMSRNDAGEVVSAKAAMITYIMKGNLSIYEGDTVTEWVKNWEAEFISYGRSYSGSKITKVYIYAARSINDAFDESVLDSTYRLAGGYMLLVLYVSIVFGKFNCLEQRVWLAVGAIIGVGFSMAISLGLSNAAGFGYGAITSLLPFLLLGLGIDDGFVITQAWSCMSPDEKKLPIEIRSGLALKHAGVSITVTSVTDFVAFGVGATTVLPGLRGFCIYACFGIVAVFFAQATFFSACVVIDERRRLAMRNACCACYAHGDDFTPNRFSEKEIQQTFFSKHYAKFITYLPVKIVVLIVSLGVLGGCLYGLINLKTEYDPEYYMPRDHYMNDYNDAVAANFPDLGFFVTGYIYVGDVNYYEDADKLYGMIDEFKQLHFVNKAKVDYWMIGYRQWLQNDTCAWVVAQLNATTRWPLDNEKFYMLVLPYLYLTSHGPRHLSDLVFEDTPSVDLPSLCTNPVSSAETLSTEQKLKSVRLTASRIPFEYVEIEGTENRIAAMDESRALVAKYFPFNKAFSYSRIYSRWETDKIIQGELYRNLGLAFVCIVFLTLFLIADIVTCLLVSFCTVSAFVETGGIMYFWEIPIEMSSSILLILAIGFAVDYSAHIGHSFMTMTGTRNERVKKALSDIGPAVFNGGFSTLLAVSLLSFANSDIFLIFFQVNLCVIAFGLWNGLMLLPVLLSWVGSAPYLSAHESLVSNAVTDKDSELGHDNKAIDVSTEEVDDIISLDAKPEGSPNKFPTKSVEASPAKESLASGGRDSKTAWN